MENNLSERQLKQQALEKAWLAADMADEPLWHTFPCVRRSYAICGRAYVLWRQVDQSPSILEVYTVSDLQASADYGLHIWLKPRLGAAPLRVGHHPRLTHSAFFWIPAHADVRYVPVNYDDRRARRRLSVPLCVRTQRSAREPLVEGVTYAAEIAEFRKLFPSTEI